VEVEVFLRVAEYPGGDGQLSARGWLIEGMLRFMQYRVGRTNDMPTGLRQMLLAQIFVSHLPPVFPADYLQGWGQPGSALRLQKMAESIAAFARNAKRNESVDLADAITDWEDDLQYLYETYYVGHFHFAWPTSEVIWT
jgi:hypothetical protein